MGGACSGLGTSGFADLPLDMPTPSPKDAPLSYFQISVSHLFCIVQHKATWPEYYCIIDCRSQSAFDDNHLVGAIHKDSIAATLQQTVDQIIVVLYADNPKSTDLTNFLQKLAQSDGKPSTVFVLRESLAKFKRLFFVVMDNFSKTKGEQPGPLQLVPATRSNPAVFRLQRNQFQHCKTTVAYLHCSTVLNFSARRLFLKSANIVTENVLFDGVNEPYDEALAIFAKSMANPSGQSTRGNLLIIDETDCAYGALIVGWWWIEKGFPLDQVCSLLEYKMGVLDSWYSDVLRSWAENPDGAGAGASTGPAQPSSQ